MLPQRWPTLQPLLDQALDATPTERAEQLAQIKASDPELAAQLARLLDDQRRADAVDFLRHSPAPDLFATPLTGQRLGAYTLTEALGEGGMGSVWLARRNDGHYEGLVAVKLLNRTLAGPAMAARFRREGQILARLTHPHIARLLDAGVSPQGQPYLVLEYVQGHRIDHYADARKLSVQARLNLFLALLEAVAHAHHHLVVHRDIKPSNVMVTNEGQLKLLDFGIAKLMAEDDAVDTPLTQQAGAFLSPGHAAPEQWRAEPVTPATDVFALGVLLTLLLAGRHPFVRPGDSTADAMRSTLERTAPRLSSLAADTAISADRSCSPQALGKLLRGDLDTIVAKSLNPDPNQRFPSAEAMAQDLRRHLAHQPILSRRPSLAYRWGKFVQRQRVPLLVASLGALTVAGAGFNAWQQKQQAQVSQARAQAVDGLLQSVFEGMGPDMAASRMFQARELLDRSRDYLEHTPSLDAESRRQAQRRMAVLYRDIGAYDQALPLLQAEVQQARTGTDPAALAAALWQVANVELKTDAFDAAGQTLQALQSLVGERLSGDPAMPGQVALLQAEMLFQKGQFNAAQAQFERAQTLLRPPATFDLELMARLLAGRGRAEQRNGNLNQARSLYNQALSLQTQRGAQGTVDRLDLQVDLGSLENWQGHFEAALPKLEGAHAELKARLGGRSDKVAQAAGQVAYAHLRLGHFALAREWADTMRSAADPVATEKDDYPELLDALSAMYQGRDAQAEPLLNALLHDKLQAESGVSPKTEPLRRMHAQALLRLNRLSQAQAELDTTLANQTRLTHAGHSSVAITQILAGCLAAKQGQLALARQHWSEANAVLTQSLGPQHPFALAAASYLALTEPTNATQAQSRVELSQRVRRELGWQAGADTLARWLASPDPVRAWSDLPAVL